MKAVVTGASGFLGGSLVRSLGRAGWQVDAYSRRGGPAVRQVADYREIAGSPDAVLFHLAEPSGVAEAAAQVAEIGRLCADLLAKAWRHVVYASSAAVYGDRRTTPWRADEAAAGAGPYAEAKRRNEAAVLAAGGVAARLANLYGPGMTRGTVLADLLDGLDRPGPLTLRSGTPVRDFLHVDDAAEALRLLAGRQGIFNVGSGGGVSIAELTRLCLQLAGQGAREVRWSAPAETSSHLVLDCTATQRETGWRPKVPLRTGLAGLITGTRHG